MTTKIEWTDESWNPVTGCTKVSAGCQNCYAERMAKRLRGRFGYPDDDPFRVTLHPDRLEQPLRWRKPRRVFVCSMGDLFHEDVPDEFIDQVFAVMALAKEHTFQVLTKRPERMKSYLSDRATYQRVRKETEEGDVCGLYLDSLCGWEFRQAQNQWWTNLPPDRWPLPNVWLGTSVEDQATADERIPQLLECPAAVRFVSCEPLLSSVDLTRWLEASYNPQYGGEQTSGRVGLSVGAGRAFTDRRAGACLEGDHEGREQHGEVSPGPGDAGRGAAPCPRTSTGMASLLRSDPREPSDQPQERERCGQSAGEPRGGDPRGERSTCSKGSEGGAHGGAVGRSESCGEADATPGPSDSEASSEGGATEGDRRGLRDQRSHSEQDRARSPLAWCVIGGESGPGARPCDIRWITSIRDQCKTAGVPVFIKQLGSNSVWREITRRGRTETWREKRRVFHDSKGGDPDEWPHDLRVREYPTPRALEGGGND